MDNEILLKISSQLERIERLLIMQGKEVFTSEEAALYMGIGLSHLAKLVKDRAIPYYQKGTGCNRYFKKSDIDAYCCSQHVADKDEINQEAATYILRKTKR